MTLEEAKEILKDYYEDGDLVWKSDKCLEYLDYIKGDDSSCLDGNFTADELEAIAIIMRQKWE